MGAQSDSTLPPPPDERSLREVAFAHLARFSTTQAGLQRVLERYVLRWSRRVCARIQEQGGDEDQHRSHLKDALALTHRVAQEMVEKGIVDDKAFARSRIRSLGRTGRSKRAIGAHLVQRGLAADKVKEIFSQLEDTDLTEQERELSAAVIQARKRRIGPFQKDGVEVSEETRQKGLAALARAGFDRNVAEQVMSMQREEAEERIIRFKTS